MKPYYQDNHIRIYNKESWDMSSKLKDIKVIKVTYVKPPPEVVEAVKKADKPRITIILTR